MKRWGIVWACLGLLMFTSHVLAIGSTTIGDVASSIPEETAFYFVMRTDDQVLDDLNAFVDRMTDKLVGLGMPSIDLEDELRKALADGGTDYDEIRPAIGDYIAVAADLEFAESSMRGTMNEVLPQGFQIYIQVADRQLLESVFEFGRSRGTQGDYTLYKLSGGDIWFALSDEWLVVMTDDELPELGESLAAQPGYQETLAKLPGDDYLALVYASAEAMGSTVQDSPRELRELTAQNIMVGLALQDERHVILDLVQTVAQDSPILQAIPNVPIDQSFLRYVPKEADYLLQLNDLSGYIDYFDLYMKTAVPGFNLRREMERGLRTANLDLEDDLLSWMDGEAVLYATFDMEHMLESAGQFETVPFEFGLVVETSDADASARFFETLGQLAKENSTPDAQVGSATINGVKVTTLRMKIPNAGQMLDYVIIMGATDEVAFIASADAAEFITAGRGDSLLDNPDFIEASELYVPQSKQLFYVSDDGLITIGAGVAAIIYLGSGMPLPGMDQFQAASPYVAYQPSSTDFILELLRDIVHSASVTTSVSADGIQVNRFVISLE